MEEGVLELEIFIAAPFVGHCAGWLWFVQRKVCSNDCLDILCLANLGKSFLARILHLNYPDIALTSST